MQKKIPENEELRKAQSEFIKQKMKERQILQERR